MYPYSLIPDSWGWSIDIYLYGICMAVGIIACFGFLMFAMWKMKFNDDASTKILFVGFFGTATGILFAAIFQGLYNYIANPSAGFKLNSMTFLGGLIGGAACFLGMYWLYIYIIAPRAKSKLLKNNMNATLTDALPFIPIAIVIAHGFGRLGCFFGGCCYGMSVEEIYEQYGVTVWGLACSAPGGVHSSTLVVPTQLYEMFFLFALAIVMSILYFKFKFNYNFALYMFSYGVWRFFIEFIRGDARGEFIGTALYPSQIWSLVMIALGIGYIFLQRFVLEKHMKHPELTSEKQETEQTAETAEAAGNKAE